METTIKSTLPELVLDHTQTRSYTYTANSHTASLTLCFDCASVYIPDANGNITQVADDTGNLVAAYEYGPFGGTVSGSGHEADSNTFRFSTKYWDEETQQYYYGYRYYRPGWGRWPNRDPIGEAGSRNLYAFVRNAPTYRLDRFGLAVVVVPPTDDMGVGAGWARCDVDTGNMEISFVELCAGDCVEKHERQHAAFAGTCCERLKKCWDAATDDAGKVACGQAYLGWSNDSDAKNECLADKAEMDCLRAWIDGNKEEKSCCANKMRRSHRVTKFFYDRDCVPLPDAPDCPFDEDGGIIEE